MVRSKREKATGRKEGGKFALLPESVLLSAEFHSIPGEAVRLLVTLAAQYNGHNNGNLCAALSVLRKYGFCSSDTVSRALQALLEAGLIVRTRDGTFYGGNSRCALYAVAWARIDACPDKNLTVGPTATAPRLFLTAEKNKTPCPKIGHIPIRKSERSSTKSTKPDPKTGAETGALDASSDPKVGLPLRIHHEG